MVTKKSKAAKPRGSGPAAQLPGAAVVPVEHLLEPLRKTFHEATTEERQARHEEYGKLLLSVCRVLDEWDARHDKEQYRRDAPLEELGDILRYNPRHFAQLLRFAALGCGIARSIVVDPDQGAPT